jgi:hypothetical protein
MIENYYVGSIVYVLVPTSQNNLFRQLGCVRRNGGFYEEVGDNCFIKDKYKIPKETVRKTSHPFYTKLFNYIFRRNKTKKI